jgi:hypothetical protein
MKKPVAIVASKQNLWAGTGNLRAWPPGIGKKKQSQRPTSTRKLGPGTKKRGCQ